MGDHKGFVMIDRALLDHWVWTAEPFSKGQAWVDLILMANHKKNKVLISGKLIEVDRGSKITSTRSLAERWKWNRRTVNRFLKLLQDDGMIVYEKCTTQYTAITIVNYTKWQDKYKESAPRSTPPNTPPSTQQGTPRGSHPVHINNNDNNENNDNKNIYIAGQARPRGSESGKNLRETVSSDASVLAEKTADDRIPYREIIDYLNAKTGASYKAQAKATREKIHARWAEGYRLDDFKRVVDVKAGQWKNDKKMAKYLRPETLFGPKFEGYVNEGLEAPKSAYEIQFERDLQATMEGWGQ